MKLGKIVLMLLIMFRHQSAQVDTSEITIESIIESLFEDQEEGSEENEINDILDQFNKYPLDINLAGLSDLMTIPLLDVESANKIINHRERSGRFFSKSELYLIDGFSPELVSQLIQFITINDQRPEKDILSSNRKIKRPLSLKFRSRFNNDLQQRKAFSNNKFAGSPLKTYNRMTLNYGNDISAGITVEKDPGEISFADFMSFHLSLRNIYNLEHLVLGDYTLENGQGLLFWNPYGIKKNSSILSPTRSSRDLTPYSSTNETEYLKGAAAYFRLKFLRLLLFYSSKRFDAVVDSAGIIISTPVDGYHRTLTEINKKDIAGEIIIGGKVIYEPSKLLQLNLLYNHSLFSHPLSKWIETKKEFRSLSFSYNYFPGNLSIAGEIAYNGNSAAGINNFFIAVNNNLKLVSSFRYYPADFYTPHGRAFGERSSVGNEIGYYSGIDYRIGAARFSLYYDQFKFPAGSSGFPFGGNEWCADSRINIRPIELNFTCRRSFKEEVNQNIVYGRISETYKLNAGYSPVKGFKFKTRIGYKISRQESSHSEGYLLQQDFNYKYGSINLYTRFSFFETDDFFSALYSFENDLPGMFRNYALYGEGVRWYLMLRYLIQENISISFRYSETYKPREDVIGTGDSQINRNLDNNVGIQIDYNLN